MYETKADALEASFDGVTQGNDAVQSEITALRDDIAAMKRSLDRKAISQGRPMLGEAKSTTANVPSFTNDYLRKGMTGGVEMKALAATSGAEGGYAVPQEIDATIDSVLKQASPIRTIANVVRVGSAGYRKLVTMGGVASGWAAEDGARDESDTPVFAEIMPPMGDLYANPAASQAMRREPGCTHHGSHCSGSGRPTETAPQHDGGGGRQPCRWPTEVSRWRQFGP